MDAPYKNREKIASYVLVPIHPYLLWMSAMPSKFLLKRSSYLVFAQGEGVTYRGRVLVELETKLGELPDEESDDLPSDEIIRIQVDYWFVFF